MSQILKRLSQPETDTPASLRAEVPDNLFELPQRTAAKTPTQNQARWKLIGVCAFLFALLGISGWKWTRQFKSHGQIESLSALSQARQLKVVELNRQAVEFFYAGNFDRAAQLLENAESLDSKDATSQINLGIVRRHQNKISDANSEFSKALALNPMNAWALNGLGRLQLDSGNYELAEDFLRRASQGNPAPAETLLNLGELAEQKEDWQLASQYYARYLENPHADQALKMMISRRNLNILSITKAKE